jgi:hypothetical protein
MTALPTNRRQSKIPYAGPTTAGGASVGVFMPLGAAMETTNSLVLFKSCWSQTEMVVDAAPLR